MDSLKVQDKVFPLSADGNAKVEYKNYRFYVHSHKENSKPIILSKTDMKDVCKLLPILQEEASRLMEQTPLIINDVSPKKKKRRDDSKTVEPTVNILEDKDWKNFVISKYKRYETRLTLNTFDEKPFIWLRVFFDPDYVEEKEKMDKKLKWKRELENEKTMLPCRGGVLFNDTNVIDLTRFVKSQ